ncbi:MAG: hypothetical protein QW692_03215 [Nitrososphaerota archaeon]
MERRRKAISAVLGTAIALVIVFTVFIPLIMYLQSLQTIFMQEANRRLQYELERIHEKLEVHISITPAGKVYPNHYLRVIIYNPGVLTVDIPTIYIESKYKGIIEVPVDLSIPPGGKLAYSPLEKFYISPGEDDIVRVKVVTLRGNNYVSKETLGPRGLPYYLIVTVSNMTFGRRYAIEVAKSSEYGCILLPTQQDPGCGETRRAVLEPQSFNDTEGLVVFQASPGNYTVSLYDITDNPDSGESLIPEMILEVYDDVILNLPIPEIKWPEVAPLRVGVIHKNLTIIAGENENPEVVIPYLVSLGTIAEPLRDILVKISFSEGSCTVKYSDSKKWNISKLYPGETYLANFTMVCNSMGRVGYSLEITEAYGALSNKYYEKFENSSARGVIKICVMEKKTVVVGIEDGKPVTEEIRYVRCP